MHEISDATIRQLVDTFYAKVRADHELGPIFDHAMQDQWDAHLATMVDFWASVMLTAGRYKGNPVAVHQAVPGIRPELFPRWLHLFDETCRELFTQEIAAAFTGKATRIADSLQHAVFFRRQPARQRTPA